MAAASDYDQEPISLALSQQIERSIEAGTVDRFLLEIGEGPLLRVTADQLGIDLVLAVADRNGEPLARVDSLDESMGLELIVVPVQVGVQAMIEVEARPNGPRSGRYRLVAEQPAAASARLKAERLLTEGAELQLQGTAEALQLAEAKYEQALNAWQKLHSAWGQGRACHALGVLAFGRGDWDQAREWFESAVEEWRRADDRFGAALTLHYLGLTEVLSRGNLELAYERYYDSLAEYRFIKDHRGEATTLNNIAFALLQSSDPERAEKCLTVARQAAAQANDPWLEGEIVHNLAGCQRLLGAHLQARRLYTEAFHLRKQAGDRRGEAESLSSLGVTHRRLGAYQEALESYMEAFRLCSSIEDLKCQGNALSNIGRAYLALGQPQRALGFLEQALPLRRQTRDRRGEETTLINMGRAHARLGQLDEGLDLLQQALDKRRESQNRRDTATTLSYLGDVLTRSGKCGRALAVLGEALDIRQQIGDQLRVGTTLTFLGQAEAACDLHERAVAHLTEASTIARKLGSEEQQLVALGSLAQACLQAGEVQKSLVYAAEAMDLVESRRVGIPSPELRASYLASRQQPYQLAVTAHMLLQQQEPSGSHARAALALNERRRARSLIDLLVEAGVVIRHGITPDLLEQRTELQDHLRELAYNYQSGYTADQPAKQSRLESQLGVTRTELAVVESRIRRQSPVYDEITRPRPLQAEQIMALLDRDTLLLEYALGNNESFVWAVTDQAVEAFELPPRTQVEEAARDLHRAWSTRDIGAAKEEAAAAQRLADMVVAPVAEYLDHSNLVVVADGALHYIPFGALPQPESGSPLLVEHKVSHLPSISALAIQRQRLATRSPPANLLAVLADPVFGQNDPRLVRTRREIKPLSTADELPRLPASRHEAEALLGLVADQKTFTALGLAANREVVVSGQLDTYRYIHLATHGVLDTAQPELSGLVLSMLDDAGQPCDGFLRLQDIYNLQLQADLVVLSGCRTALGLELRGEGMVGLSRGFLLAGTRRVVASLWQVQDRATAELMIHLYQALLVDGMSPSQALRQAQLRVRKDRRWRDPYYWAGFILIGDWQ